MGATGSIVGTDDVTTTIIHRIVAARSREFSHWLEYSKEGSLEEVEQGKITVVEVESQEELNSKLQEVYISPEFTIIVADCAGVTSLDVLKGLEQEESNTSIGGLGLQNNQLTDDEIALLFESAAMADLLYLNLSGNAVTNLAKVFNGGRGLSLESEVTSTEQIDENASTLRSASASMISLFWMRYLSNTRMSSIVVLDLSYIENLQIGTLPFLTMPLMRKLVLDGCGISTCTIESNTEARSPLNSIFFGLLSLEELSLAENLLEETSAIDGLSFFGSICEYQTEEISPENNLKRLNLSENPFRVGTNALKLEVDCLVIELIPGLEELDGRKLHSQTEDVSQLSVGRIANNDIAAGFTPGGAGDLDIADKEFLAALRGEKDVSVVA
jgi:hypothetical protein